MGGIGALRGAFIHELGLLETGRRGVQELVGTVALSDALAEVDTVSAACRSEKLSRNCSTFAVASRAGERPGRSSRGYRSAKYSSFHSPSRRSRTHIAVVPSRLLARVNCAVRDGTSSPERGRRDNGHLYNGIGFRNSPSMPADQAAAPEGSKIPDRVKLVLCGIGMWGGSAAECDEGQQCGEQCGRAADDEADGVAVAEGVQGEWV